MSPYPQLLVGYCEVNQKCLTCTSLCRIGYNLWNHTVSKNTCVKLKVTLKKNVLKFQHNAQPYYTQDLSFLHMEKSMASQMCQGGWVVLIDFTWCEVKEFWNVLLLKSTLAFVKLFHDQVMYIHAFLCCKRYGVQSLAHMLIQSDISKTFPPCKIVMANMSAK